MPHAVACRALGVAPSTFYKHRDRSVTQMQLRRQAVDAEVKKAFDKSQGTYGSPRVRAQLRRDGTSVSKKTVEASMARQGLCARPKKKKGITSQNPGAAAPSDLLGRDFSAQAISQKWCGDFKEAPTAEGKVFLATVEDLYSRRMVGSATSDHHPTAELAKAAINTAVATRGGDVKGVIFHSDREPNTPPASSPKPAAASASPDPQEEQATPWTTPPPSRSSPPSNTSSSTNGPGRPKPAQYPVRFKPDKKSPYGSTAGTTSNGRTPQSAWSHP